VPPSILKTVNSVTFWSRILTLTSPCLVMGAWNVIGTEFDTTAPPARDKRGGRRPGDTPSHGFFPRADQGRKTDARPVRCKAPHRAVACLPCSLCTAAGRQPWGHERIALSAVDRVIAYTPNQQIRGPRGLAKGQRARLLFLLDTSFWGPLIAASARTAPSSLGSGRS